jgi:hypothetical protein
MRIKNITWPLYLRLLLPITMRDAVVFAGCLLREWSSLRAFPLVIRYFGNMLAQRKKILARRRVSDAYIASWFRSHPVSMPAPAAAKR